MYTQHPPPPISEHLRIVLLRCAIAAAIVVPSLAIGMGGYRGFEGLSVLDSLLNASMILSGMGQITTPVTAGGKLFASGYALFSAGVFLTVAALVSGPIVHRTLHRFHYEMGRKNAQASKKTSD